MAIDLTLQFPNQVIAGDAAYPYGKARNRPVPNDPTGTPWEASIVNDWLGFHQALLVAAGITPSGPPDAVGSSQYLQAIQALIANAVNPVSATASAAHALATALQAEVNILKTLGYFTFTGEEADGNLTPQPIYDRTPSGSFSIVNDGVVKLPQRIGIYEVNINLNLRKDGAAPASVGFEVLLAGVVVAQVEGTDEGNWCALSACLVLPITDVVTGNSLIVRTTHGDTDCRGSMLIRMLDDSTAAT
jgi:hypothetical protein